MYFLVPLGRLELDSRLKEHENLHAEKVEEFGKYLLPRHLKMAIFLSLPNFSPMLFKISTRVIIILLSLFPLQRKGSVN